MGAPKNSSFPPFDRLGMSKVEIKSKFDEIVAFSKVEKFLDIPSKHYSSGMQGELTATKEYL